MQAASCAVYAGIRIPKRRICESVHGSVRNAVHTMTGMSMLQSISGMRVCVLCTACSDRNIEKTVGHTGIARLCLTQWCHRTRTDGSLLRKEAPASIGGGGCHNELLSDSVHADCTPASCGLPPRGFRFFLFYFTTLKFVLQAPVGGIFSDFFTILFVHFYRFFMNILFKFKG